VMGCWTALIILEQAIFNRIQQVSPWLWLVLTSCALGVGMWGSVLIGQSLHLSLSLFVPVWLFSFYLEF
jgi:NO-binding membrane sensor protein with MHYT domain